MSLFYITDGDLTYIRMDTYGKYVPVRNRALAYKFGEKWKAEKVLKNNLTPQQRKTFHIEEDQEENKIKNEISEVDELKNKLKFLNEFVGEIETRRNKLYESQSRVDKEITDIQHYIELKNELNNDSIISTYNMLKEKLKERRKIKDELSIIRQFTECKVSTIGDVLSEITKSENRIYVPRIMTKLFNDVKENDKIGRNKDEIGQNKDEIGRNKKTYK